MGKRKPERIGLNTEKYRKFKDALEGKGGMPRLSPKEAEAMGRAYNEQNPFKTPISNYIEDGWMRRGQLEVPIQGDLSRRGGRQRRAANPSVVGLIEAELKNREASDARQKDDYAGILEGISDAELEDYIKYLKSSPVDRVVEDRVQFVQDRNASAPLPPTILPLEVQVFRNELIDSQLKDKGWEHGLDMSVRVGKGRGIAVPISQDPKFQADLKSATEIADSIVMPPKRVYDILGRATPTGLVDPTINEYEQRRAEILTAYPVNFMAPQKMFLENGQVINTSWLARRKAEVMNFITRNLQLRTLDIGEFANRTVGSPTSGYGKFIEKQQQAVWSPYQSSLLPAFFGAALYGTLYGLAWANKTVLAHQGTRSTPEYFRQAIDALDKQVENGTFDPDSPEFYVDNKEYMWRKKYNSLLSSDELKEYLIRQIGYSQEMVSKAESLYLDMQRGMNSSWKRVVQGYKNQAGVPQKKVSMAKASGFGGTGWSNVKDTKGQPISETAMFMDIDGTFDTYKVAKQDRERYTLLADQQYEKLVELGGYVETDPGEVRSDSPMAERMKLSSEFYENAARAVFGDRLMYIASEGQGYLDPYASATWESEPDRMKDFLVSVYIEQKQLNRKLTPEEIMLEKKRFVNPWTDGIAEGVLDVVNFIPGAAFDDLLKPLLKSLGKGAEKAGKFLAPFWFNEAVSSIAGSMQRRVLNTFNSMRKNMTHEEFIKALKNDLPEVMYEMDKATTSAAKRAVWDTYSKTKRMELLQNISPDDFHSFQDAFKDVVKKKQVDVYHPSSWKKGKDPVLPYIDQYDPSMIGRQLEDMYDTAISYEREIWRAAKERSLKREFRNMDKSTRWKIADEFVNLPENQIFLHKAVLDSGEHLKMFTDKLQQAFIRLHSAYEGSVLIEDSFLGTIAKWAYPNKNIRAVATILNAFAKGHQKIVGWWATAVLSLSPRWVIRNLIESFTRGALDGGHPLADLANLLGSGHARYFSKFDVTPVELGQSLARQGLDPLSGVMARFERGWKPTWGPISWWNFERMRLIKEGRKATGVEIGKLFTSGMLDAPQSYKKIMNGMWTGFKENVWYSLKAVPGAVADMNTSVEFIARASRFNDHYFREVARLENLLKYRGVNIDNASVLAKDIVEDAWKASKGNAGAFRAYIENYLKPAARSGKAKASVGALTLPPEFGAKIADVYGPMAEEQFVAGVRNMMDNFILQINRKYHRLPYQAEWDKALDNTYELLEDWVQVWVSETNKPLTGISGTFFDVRTDMSRPLIDFKEVRELGLPISSPEEFQRIRGVEQKTKFLQRHAPPEISLVRVPGKRNVETITDSGKITINAGVGARTKDIRKAIHDAGIESIASKSQELWAKADSAFPSRQAWEQDFTQFMKNPVEYALSGEVQKRQAAIFLRQAIDNREVYDFMVKAGEAHSVLHVAQYLKEQGYLYDILEMTADQMRNFKFSEGFITDPQLKAAAESAVEIQGKWNAKYKALGGLSNTDLELRVNKFFELLRTAREQWINKYLREVHPGWNLSKGNVKVRRAAFKAANDYRVRQFAFIEDTFNNLLSVDYASADDMVAALEKALGKNPKEFVMTSFGIRDIKYKRGVPVSAKWTDLQNKVREMSPWQLEQFRTIFYENELKLAALPAEKMLLERFPGIEFLSDLNLKSRPLTGSKKIDSIRQIFLNSLIDVFPTRSAGGAKAAARWTQFDAFQVWNAAEAQAHNWAKITGKPIEEYFERFAFYKFDAKDLSLEKELLRGLVKIDETGKVIFMGSGGDGATTHSILKEISKWWYADMEELAQYDIAYKLAKEALDDYLGVTGKASSSMFDGDKGKRLVGSFYDYVINAELKPKNIKLKRPFENLKNMMARLYGGMPGPKIRELPDDLRRLLENVWIDVAMKPVTRQPRMNAAVALEMGTNPDELLKTMQEWFPAKGYTKLEDIPRGVVERAVGRESAIWRRTDEAFDVWAQRHFAGFPDEVLVWKEPSKVVWDSERGFGNVPLQKWDPQAQWRQKHIVSMTPDEFLDLVPPIVETPENTVWLKKAMQNRNPIARPWVEVEWNAQKNAWQIVSHEGRHRALALKSAFPGERLQVDVIYSGQLRSNSVNPDMMAAPFLPELRSRGTQMVTPRIAADFINPMDNIESLRRYLNDRIMNTTGTISRAYQDRLALLEDFQTRMMDWIIPDEFRTQLAARKAYLDTLDAGKPWTGDVPQEIDPAILYGDILDPYIPEYLVDDGVRMAMGNSRDAVTFLEIAKTDIEKLKEFIREGRHANTLIPESVRSELSGLVGIMTDNKAEIVTTATRNAIDETNRIMINYNYNTRADMFMKSFMPFWKFPSRSLPYWVQTLATHPQLLAGYAKLRNLSISQRYEVGAVTSSGKPLPSLDGYVKVPGTDLWFSPLSPYSWAYPLTATMKVQYNNEDEIPPAAWVAREMYELSNIFGFSPTPWISFMVRLAVGATNNEWPMSPWIPQMSFLPRYHLKDLMFKIGVMFASSDPSIFGSVWTNRIQPQINYHDYMVETKTLQEISAIIDDSGMPESEKWDLVLNLRQAIKYKGNATAQKVQESDLALRNWQGGQRQMNYPEAQELADLYNDTWRELYEKYIDDEVLRNVRAWGMGYYMKPFTDAQANFTVMRNDRNRLIDSLNNRTTAGFFGYPSDPDQAYQIYKDFRETPEGFLLNLYSFLGWQRSPGGELLLDPEERNKAVAASIFSDDMVTQSYREISRITKIKDRKLLELGWGAPWELRQEVYDSFYSDLTKIRNYYYPYKGSYKGTNKPVELIMYDLEDAWWSTILKTKPNWSEDMGYEEWRAAEENWLNNLPMIAKSAMGKGIPKGAAKAQVAAAKATGRQDYGFQYDPYVMAVMGNLDTDQIIPESFFDDLMNKTSATSLDAWKVARGDNLFDAINWALDETFYDPYWDSMREYETIDGIKTDKGWKNQYEQEIIRNSFVKDNPVTPQSIFEAVSRRYGTRFTFEEVQNLLTLEPGQGPGIRPTAKYRKVWSVEERQDFDKTPLDRGYDDVWDQINRLGPGGKGLQRFKNVLSPVNQDKLDRWLDSGGDLWKYSEMDDEQKLKEVTEFIEALKTVLDEMGIPEFIPEDRLPEMAEAARHQAEFKVWVMDEINKLHPDKEPMTYDQLMAVMSVAYDDRSAPPSADDSKRIGEYYRLRDEWGKEHQLWYDYYRRDLSPYLKELDIVKIPRPDSMPDAIPTTPVSTGSLGSPSWSDLISPTAYHQYITQTSQPPSVFGVAPKPSSQNYTYDPKTWPKGMTEVLSKTEVKYISNMLARPDTYYPTGFRAIERLAVQHPEWRRFIDYFYNRSGY